MIRNILSTLVIASAAISSSLAQTESETFTTTYKVNELMGLIGRMYVEDVDREELELDFIRGMHNNLSPFQAYHKDSLLKRMRFRRKTSIKELASLLSSKETQCW